MPLGSPLAVQVPPEGEETGEPQAPGPAPKLSRPVYTVGELIPSGGVRHRFVQLAFDAAHLNPNNPEFKVDLGELAIGERLIGLNVSPVGDCFVVAWNGDGKYPVLRFDDWPASQVRVQLECFGR